MKKEYFELEDVHQGKPLFPRARRTSARGRGWGVGRAFLPALLAATFSASGHACSCAGPAYFGGPDEWARAVLPGSTFAVHAKVESRLPGNSARLHVIESFRRGEVPLEIKGRNGNCGVVFHLGEEAIFMADSDGLVNLCGKHEAKPELLQALRARSGSDANRGAR